MEVSQFIINVTSEQRERLIDFYANVVGLPRNADIGEGAFNVGNSAFIIDGHSETKGPAKEPQRVLINFFVDDLKAEQERLEQQGVQFIRKAGQEEWGGVISTFLDPDGNYCQLIEYKPQ
ncbi:MAG: VOC family protein [Dehalococcoidia bacterium]|nr:VOC family protein [Dehalococcoidia bacterium]MDZ4279049.1 VOC family protein [Dehalococcoidia bacterium]